MNGKMIGRRKRAFLVGALLLAPAALFAGEGHVGPARAFHTGVPVQPFSLILGRPARTSVSCSVLTAVDGTGFVRYGKNGGACSSATASVSFQAGKASDVVMEGLDVDSAYRYIFYYRAGTAGVFTASAEYAFHTQREVGRPFVFTVTADSHLDENTDPALYGQTLRNARAERPDFHIDLGDTFMTGKRGGEPEKALPQYMAQRYYFGLLGCSAPLFLALGNHDGESGPSLNAATRMRRSLFPNPVPDVFYSGGTNGNYYAWQWGAALFVVLDPYRAMQQSRRGVDEDGWRFTLGRPQYDWLLKTLESSDARYKFVFVHQLAGGKDRQGRGGAEAVPYGEWGGHDGDGRDVFSEKRPGWPMPVHALLVKHKVTAVFHGHDHFYARQEADGIIYQLVPQPGCPGEGSIRQAASYGYTTGEMKAGSGYLRVSVQRPSIVIDYVRSR